LFKKKKDKQKNNDLNLHTNLGIGGYLKKVCALKSKNWVYFTHTFRWFTI